MCPVNDRRSPRIVNDLAANLDAVPHLNGTRRSDADVVDDFESPCAALYVEGFVHRVGARSIKEVWLRRDGRVEIDPSRRRSGICGGQIHRGYDHALRTSG